MEEEIKRPIKFLFFDTETTGLPKDWIAPATETDNWPRLVQLAWAVYLNNEPIIERNLIATPSDFEIPEEAAKVHGITTEIAKRRGYPLENILRFFGSDLMSCDAIVAHNIGYDSKIMGAEFYRTKNTDLMDEISLKPQFDTMIAGTDYCKIPGNNGGYKWPKLSELHFRLFGEGFDGAHDAFADTNACARCFFELAKREVIEI
ncbi:MAG: 3'-5' exonuclease [Negativicutes bacterium]|nr:3'-5' exonuclease [Negativicutes bacterium]